ncbi:MAG: M23 family metallopeptidase [Deltaproteobacteria bacterium]|nr:M23 family metallopeptidase [Deltaproteobacteria bacterium]
MDEISFALNPPRFRKFKKPPIRIARSESPVWPLPAINGREPVILEPATNGLRGIELAYARVGSDDALKECPPGTPNGTATHLMPQMTPVFSIDGGEITFAGRLGHGYGIIINHGNGYASHYAHLGALVAIRTDLYRPRDQYVRAGDVIGYVGAPEPGAFKRLYFELWERDRSRHLMPIDPRPRLAECKLKREYDHFTPAPPVAQKEAA